MAHVDDAEWRRVMSVNVDGAFRLCRAALPLISLSEAGRIVNTSSAISTRGNPKSGPYAVSKHALDGLTRAFAVEAGSDKLTVNAVNPGSIRTGLTRKYMDDPKFCAEMLRRTPLGRLGQPEDVARVILFLASDDAAYVNGHTMAVDGGMHAIL
jgi:NAD(P)-dependent dehydrogenase (short-subunit alcohol dehydrogenase family)